MKTTSCDEWIIEFIEAVDEELSFKDLKLTDFQREFLIKWLQIADNQNWMAPTPEDWADQFKLSNVYDHPLGRLYDIYNTYEALKEELDTLIDGMDWLDLEKEMCKKEVLNTIIKMDDGRVVFLDTEGVFGFIDGY